MAETRKHVRTPKKQANEKQQYNRNKFSNQTNKKWLRMPTIGRKTRRQKKKKKKKKNENRRTKKKKNKLIQQEHQNHKKKTQLTKE